MKDLLIEIGCEDLPARFVASLAEALAESFVAGLTKRQISVGASTRFATPRRIAVRITQVEAEQSEQVIERKGPKLAAAIKDGRPTPAGLGFAKSCGVDFSSLAQEDGQLVFRSQQQGSKTIDLIPEIFEDALKAMDALVPKRMRWGAGSETFVRPVEWLLTLYGDDVIPLQRFGCIAGRQTYGHRFHAPAAITLTSPADYESALRSAKVWADFDGRRESIRSQIEAEAVKLGGTPKISEDLLNEVTALVEWPVVISGRIDQKFLELPPEVIVATVETNQRYFTVFKYSTSDVMKGAAAEGTKYLLPVFITISNIGSKDVAKVIEGNERVVRPRLSDALFFWKQDLKLKLPGYAAQLETVMFQKELGTIAEKVSRIETLAAKIDSLLPRDQSARLVDVGNAARLCKADLATKMVYEFPELQGLMGSYYAAKSSESEAVATAIREHYLPTQAGTPIPSTIEGQIVALADKLDTLAGIFAIGQKPTASKDPYALRRAALGVLRIVIEGQLDLNVRELLTAALEAQPAGKRDQSTLTDLWSFVLERLRGYALDRDISAEQFEAVRATEVTRPLDFDRRLQALRTFAGTPAAMSLTAADKRARNLLKQASAHSPAAVDPAKFEHASERALFEAVERVDAQLVTLRAEKNYLGMLNQLAQLKEPVDAFMDPATGVRVMADDPAVRANRLALLNRLDTLCREVADLSLLPG